MGLWFPASLVEEMNQDPQNTLLRFQKVLSDNQLFAFTCNAFPFGNFHESVVKTKVYHPNWTTSARLEYTLACAKILAALIPKGETGSVSTLPLGWRIGWSESDSRVSVMNLISFVKMARELLLKENRTIRLGLEPEPGCALETTLQVIEFWNTMLRPEAKLAGITDEELNTHLGLCYDTCHQAVQFENPTDMLDKIHAADIPIVKMQLSSALEFKADPDGLSKLERMQFVEPRFLHQTRIKTPGGIIGFDDLPDALAAASQVQSELWNYPWRVHYHLPIDSSDMLDSKAVATTREDMLKAYAYAVVKDRCRHFEVETYTWSVLPEAHRPKTDADLAQSIARELRYVYGKLPPDSIVNGSPFKGDGHG